MWLWLGLRSQNNELCDWIGQNHLIHMGIICVLSDSEEIKNIPRQNAIQRDIQLYSNAYVYTL